MQEKGLDMVDHGECRIITTKKNQRVAFEDALEETGSGKFTILVALMSGLCLYSVNSELAEIGFILPVAQCELQLDSYKKGLLASANFAGVISTSLFWGYLTDIKGRKPFLIYNLAAAFLVSFLSAFMQSFWGYLFMRFINGVCISAPACVAFVYLEEFQNSRNRAKSFTIAAEFIALALIALPTLGWLILQNSNTSVNLFGLHELTNWRIYILINSMPYLITCLALIWFPESPKFLYYNGRSKESLDVLKKMHEINTGRPEEFSVESLDEKLPTPTGQNGFHQLWSNQIRPLFQRPFLFYTIAISVMQSGFFILSAGLYAWYPDILNQLSLNNDKSLKVCSALNLPYDDNMTTGLNQDGILCNDTFEGQIFILNIIIGFAYMIGYISYGIVVNALGCRNFLATCMAISSLATFALLVVTQKLLIDILFIVSIVLPGISVTILSSWTAEIYPTHVRGMVICVTVTIGRLAMVIYSAVAGIMLEWNCSVTFSFYGVCLAVGLVLSLVLPRKS